MLGIGALDHSPQLQYIYSPQNQKKILSVNKGFSFNKRINQNENFSSTEETLALTLLNIFC